MMCKPDLLGRIIFCFSVKCANSFEHCIIIDLSNTT